MPDFTAHLDRHRFAELFRDELGWDRAQGAITVCIQERPFVFNAVAQKRGFHVLHCATDRIVLLNRGLLPKLQRKIASQAHEHIVICSSESPRKQVWQWSVRLPDGRRIQHREHPFFSASPPEPFLDRLNRLRFSLEEEDDVTLVDSLNRARNALDVSAELNLFAKRPWYAQRSDKLAVAMASGDSVAFDEFIMFHRPLARFIAKRLQRWFGMDADDAEQIGVIGLIQAARRFDPDRGFQFSTYATYWVRQACQRYGPDAALMIRLPQHIIWPCFNFRRHLTRVLMREGPERAREELIHACDSDPSFYERWRRFERVMQVESLSDRRESAYREARRIVAPDHNPLRLCHLADQAAIVRGALAQLRPREARFIALKFGFDGAPQTLEEIGEDFGITRERVRQIIKRGWSDYARDCSEKCLRLTRPQSPTVHLVATIRPTRRSLDEPNSLGALATAPSLPRHLSRTLWVNPGYVHNSQSNRYLRPFPVPIGRSLLASASFVNR